MPTSPQHPQSTPRPAHSAPPATGRIEHWFAGVVLLVALATHFWLVRYNWSSAFLIGHEFRQAQTAIITRYIDEQNNFSPNYETPIFGKPWGAPLEFPLYEWAVVGVKRALGCRDFVAARIVSIGCFYLTLPAVALLLARAGMARSRRWLTLALILTCPVYIFYSRAFLQESAALCCSVWYLYFFVRLLQDRRWYWLVAIALAGSAAGTMKSLTFFAWVVPAAVFGAWCLWRDWNEKRGPRRLWATTAWGLGSMVTPLALTVWWTRFADSIKELNPATHFLTSKELGIGNYGTFSLAARLDPGTWREMAESWSASLLSPWGLGLTTLGALLLAGKQRRAAVVCLALFLVPPLTIPYAYARQDYYFYAPALLFLAFLGFAIAGVLEKRRWPFAVRATILLLPFAALLGNYFKAGGYWDMQRVRSDGGNSLANALRAITPPDGVVIIVGADWNSAIPYKCHRRALMFPQGREYDEAFVAERIEALDGEKIAALVLTGNPRNDGALRDRITNLAGLSSSAAFTHDQGDVYFPRGEDRAIRARLLAAQAHYPDLRIAPLESAYVPPETHHLSSEKAAVDFPMVSPAPTAFSAKFGMPLGGSPHGPHVGAHPDAMLWVPAPAGAAIIEWEYSIDTGGSPHPDGVTDGVIFLLTAEGANGSRRVLFRELLDPITHDNQKGVQKREIRYTAKPGDTLCFETQCNGTYSYDWAYWHKIAVAPERAAPPVP